MVCLRERLVGVDRRSRLALLEHLLQPEEVPVDALAVRRPRSVLQVPCYRLPEQRRAMCVLHAD